MTASADNVFAFPAPPKPSPAAAAVQPLAIGDIVIVCLAASMALWCAFPVASVDDDGVVTAVATRTGKTVCASRVSCEPRVYGVRADDHDAEAFAALRWTTWRDPAEAVLAFSAIGKDPRIPR